MALPPSESASVRKGKRLHLREGDLVPFSRATLQGATKLRGSAATHLSKAVQAPLNTFQRPSTLSAILVLLCCRRMPETA
eukprot:6517619-Alexandrium_andersonii.AAC.1